MNVPAVDVVPAPIRWNWTSWTTLYSNRPSARCGPRIVNFVAEPELIGAGLDVQHLLSEEERHLAVVIGDQRRVAVGVRRQVERDRVRRVDDALAVLRVHAEQAGIASKLEVRLPAAEPIGLRNREAPARAGGDVVVIVLVAHLQQIGRRADHGGLHVDARQLLRSGLAGRHAGAEVELLHVDQQIVLAEAGSKLPVRQDVYEAGGLAVLHQEFRLDEGRIERNIR